MDDDVVDLVIVDNDLVLVGLEEILARQAVTIALRTNRGEWFRNELFGAPYLTEDGTPQLLGSKDKAFVDTSIRGVILSEPEIIKIISYNSIQNYTTGRLTVNCEVQCSFGAITITEIV